MIGGAPLPCHVQQGLPPAQPGPPAGQLPRQGPCAAQLLAQRISSLDPQFPVVVTGDFNCGEDSPPYRALLSMGPQDGGLQDAYRLARPTRQPDEGTFNGFQGSRSGARIDWILVSPHFRVESAEIVVPVADERIPSDHYPVTAILSLDVPDGE